MALETVEREYLIRGIPPRSVYDVVTDYACYPRVFPEITGARVLVDEGERKQVEFRARVLVGARYVLDIRHDPEHLATRWTFVEGEVVEDSEGGWQIEARGEDTVVRYRAGVMIKAPLPRVVVNQVSNALMGPGVASMFRALEREALARRTYAQG